MNLLGKFYKMIYQEQMYTCLFDNGCLQYYNRPVILQ